MVRAMDELSLLRFALWRQALPMLREVDANPRRFAEAEGDIDRLHDIVRHLESLDALIKENVRWVGDGMANGEIKGRDGGRIARMCSKLRTVWEQHPDLRFGQLVSNLCYDLGGKVKDIYYPEDGDWEKWMDAAAERNYFVSTTPRVERNKDGGLSWAESVVLRCEHGVPYKPHNENCVLCCPANTEGDEIIKQAETDRAHLVAELQRVTKERDRLVAALRLLIPDGITFEAYPSPSKHAFNAARATLKEMEP